MGELSIQERLYPGFTCFGCGHSNPDGLHLRSYLRDGVVAAEVHPAAAHDNGFGFVNGGIVTAFLDCHAGAAVIAEIERRGMTVGGGSMPRWVTAEFSVRFLRPTPLTARLGLTAEVTESDEREMIVSTSLLAEDKPRATMRSVWKRMRPR